MKAVLFSILLVPATAAGSQAQNWKPDSVITKDGDYVVGMIVRLIPDTVYLQDEEMLREIPVKDVQRVHFAIQRDQITLKRRGRNLDFSIKKLMENTGL